jgi:uncharacterized membrane protein YgdD (TMEM256/DUF423 family)
MLKSNLFWGSFFAMTAVVLGAFGAHSLEAQLNADQLATFETGVRYQFYHAFGLLVLALLADKLPTNALKRVSYLFIAGILLFSGSIYLLACRDLLGISSWKFLGPITPLGGTCFIIGWGLLGILAFRQK